MEMKSDPTCIDILLGLFNASYVKFQVLGSGFEVISIGKKKLVRSVPTELNKDHNEILELAQVCCLCFQLDLLYMHLFIF